MLKQIISFATMALLFVLLIIWQMPGTIVFRNVLLGILLILSISLGLTSCRFISFSAFVKQPTMFLLLLLTSWFLVSLVWAVEPALSINELRGQWLIPLLCGITASLLATYSSKVTASQLIQVVFWSLLSQVVLNNILDIAYWMQTGNPPFRQAPVLYLPKIINAIWNGNSIAANFTAASGDKFSYVNNTLAALVVAEVVQRITTSQRWLPLSWPIVILSLISVLLCTYFLQFRNGNVGFMMLIIFSFFMVLVRLARRWASWKTAGLGLLMVIVLSWFGVVLYKSDPRWPLLGESAVIGLNTDHYQTWRIRSLPYPRMTNGNPVDASAYERFAWGKEGLKLVIENPMGTGYNRNAFGDGIDRKYDMNGAYRGGHAHSGLIDFAIANGVVGLLLWLSFLGGIFYTGWSAFMRGQVAPGLALMFIVTGFFSRSIVDSNIRDHMLQQFMFMAMLFAFFLNRFDNKNKHTA